MTKFCKTCQLIIFLQAKSQEYLNLMFTCLGLLLIIKQQCYQNQQSLLSVQQIASNPRNENNFLFLCQHMISWLFWSPALTKYSAVNNGLINCVISLFKSTQLFPSDWIKGASFYTSFQLLGSQQSQLIGGVLLLNTITTVLS